MQQHLEAATRRAVALAILALPVAWPHGGLVTPSVPAESGRLTLEAAPAKVTPERSKVQVRIGNAGSAPVRAIRLGVDGPPGVTATVEPSRLSTLAAGASVLALVTVIGVPESRPASLVVRASGDVDRTAALTTIDLVSAEPPVTLSLAGNTRLGDEAHPDLVAVVQNSADVPVDVTLSATAGHHYVRLALAGSDVSHAAPGAPVMVTVPARRSAAVIVEVEARRPLQRGTTALLVTATIRTPHATRPVDLTATQGLDVMLSGDVLPAALGYGSVLLVPGLVAIWIWLAVLQRDRRRLGLETPPAGKQLWEEKLWLVPAAAIGLVIAWIYSRVARVVDDAYTLRDLLTVCAVAAVAALLAAAVVVWIYRARTPAVTPISTPLTVLKAARGRDTRVMRPVYQAPDGKRGLLVQFDRGAAVITPPVEYVELDITEAVRTDDLTEAVEKISTAADHDHYLRFAPGSGYVEGPRAVVGATPSGSTREPVLKPGTFP